MFKEIRSKFSDFKALFISDPINVRYLTGFTGSRGMILITKRNAYFFTDFRYIEYAKKIVPKEFKIIQLDKKWKKDWPRLLKKLRITSIGFEEDFLTVSRLSGLKKISKGVKFKKAGGIIEQIRQIKSEKELRLTKKSQEINEKILKNVKGILKKGISEKDIEWFILSKTREYGCEEPAFNPIVAFGNNSSIPHHQNGDRKLKKGDVILIDMGVKYQGYCSDMTRTFFTKPPSRLQIKVYETVLAAQKAAIAEVKNKASIFAVNKAARNIIDKAGYTENFQHGLGHGTGLNIHELPNLGAEKDAKLQQNMITTIEPGIYIEKDFGVRIEDMVIISRSGNCNITKVKKELADAIIKI